MLEYINNRPSDILFLESHR